MSERCDVALEGRSARVTALEGALQSAISRRQHGHHGEQPDDNQHGRREEDDDWTVDNGDQARAQTQQAARPRGRYPATTIPCVQEL